MDHLATVLSGIAVVVLMIVLLLLRSLYLEKKTAEEQHLVDDLSKRVYVDALTSVRNKGGYTNFIHELQDKLDEDAELEFAIGMFDCDDLKSINDQNGHDKGDLYLKRASQLICRIFQHSPVFRIGGDEFAVVLQNGDYDNREALVSRFEAEQADICATAENDWEQVRVAVGIAVYDQKDDRSVLDVIVRADKRMYENKRMRKEAWKRDTQTD